MKIPVNNNTTKRITWETRCNTIRMTKIPCRGVRLPHQRQPQFRRRHCPIVIQIFHANTRRINTSVKYSLVLLTHNHDVVYNRTRPIIFFFFFFVLFFVLGRQIHSDSRNAFVGRLLGRHGFERRGRLDIKSTRHIACR